MKGISRHFDDMAGEYDGWKKKNEYYYDTLKKFIQRHVAPGSKVLEIGCATGEVLACTAPSKGVGIDVSPKMVEMARRKYPDLDFECSAIEDFKSDEKFDYVIMVDLLDHVYDIPAVFRSLHKFCHQRTKIIATIINPWWEPLLHMAEKMKAKMPEGPHNFVERRNLVKMFDFLDFTIRSTGYLLLLPKRIPFLSDIVNRLFPKVWGINKFSSVHYIILRPTPSNDTDLGFGCSVVIPCYNEEDNIAEAVKRLPKMGKRTEIIVVNDGSKDRTADVVKELQKEMPDLRLIDYSPNRGKGYAVKQGFDAAAEEIIMILDADMTVMPEELPMFFDLLNKGICDFVNGTRMVYPMQDKAMKAANFFGNKIFGLSMTFITEQNITDTLCGTKALYRKNYRRIKMGADKWGDFDLLFGAARNGDRILEMPVHYMARKAGQSKMKALSHGMHLLSVTWRGFKEIVLGL
jgi:2-polyprenyl-3-methyl-5-hydroxy-6-metoxy-1,4-benzoquinol methylase